MQCPITGCWQNDALWLSLLLPGLLLLFFWLFHTSGLARRLEVVAGKVTRRSWLQSVLFNLALAILLSAVCVIWKLLADAISASPFGSAHWLRISGPSLAAIAALFCLALVGLRAIVVQFPKTYWLVPALVVSAFATWKHINGPYERLRPLPSVALSAELRARAAAVGIEPERLLMGEVGFLSPERTNANVVWKNGGPAIVFGEGLFNVLPVPPQNIRPAYNPVSANEVRAITGHELAHVRLRHLEVLVPLMLVCLLVLLWAGSRFAALLVRRSSVAKPHLQVGDLASLPIVCFCLVAALVVWVHVQRVVQLWAETKADALGLEIARDPEGMIAIATRASRGAPRSASMAEQLLFYTHPTPEQRIRRAREWRAANVATHSGSSGPSAPITVRPPW